MDQIISRFRLEGTPAAVEPYGSGHINITRLVRTDAPRCYILQRVNRRVFRDVPKLMKNVLAVTSYLSVKDPDPRHVLRLMMTYDDMPYAVDADGEYWRVYEYIEGGICLDRAETADDFYQSAVAFGHFQSQLSDFPAHTLHETIPRFHDTPARFEALHAAAKKDVAGRRASVEKELDFAYAQEESAGALTEMLRAGSLPLRVTHNDTKLNNVILDEVTRTPLCVIDLDTVMPGLVAYDFGDSIRFGASTAAEDEKDLSKVRLSLPLYETYVRGFLSACGDRLTKLERETLPLGARTITLENGIRFLTDYLEGDHYYAVHRPEHNLDRCRTQFKLVGDMDARWAEMNAAIQK